MSSTSACDGDDLGPWCSVIPYCKKTYSSSFLATVQNHWRTLPASDLNYILEVIYILHYGFKTAEELNYLHKILTQTLCTVPELELVEEVSIVLDLSHSF